MDLATIIGMLLAWGALIGALLMEGGVVQSLVNLPAALLVFGGTFGAAMTSFRMEQIRALPGIVRQAFMAKSADLTETISLLVHLAERARREGLLVLEREAEELDDPFLQKGLRL